MIDGSRPGPRLGRRAIAWVGRLEAVPDMPVPAAASSADLLAWAASRVGPAAVRWAVQVGWEMASTIMEELPQFGGTPESFSVLRMGTESSTLTALVMLSGAEDVLEVAAPDALAGVDDWVRRGIGVDVVLRGIRLGHAGMSAGFMAACERWVPAQERADEMRSVSAQLFDFIDAFSGLMSRRYLTEHDRWVTSTAAARHDLVLQLLQDGSHPDLKEAGKVLSYDVNRWHTALVAWVVGDDAHHRTSGLQRGVSELLKALGTTTSLLIPVGGGVLWAWGSARTAMPAGASSRSPGTTPGSTSILEEVLELLQRQQIRVAIGIRQHGLAGFRSSHLQARATQDLMRLQAATSAAVVRYEEVDVPSLLVQDFDRAREFVRSELGPLAQEGAQNADLRSTLLAYLDEQNSPNAAAQRLHVARNTVSYRVRRAEELLQRPVSSRRRHLLVALWLVEVMGSSVLVPGE